MLSGRDKTDSERPLSSGLCLCFNTERCTRTIILNEDRTKANDANKRVLALHSQSEPRWLTLITKANDANKHVLVLQ